MDTEQKLERLAEIKKEIKDLAREAADLLDAKDNRTWHASIICALDDDHTFLCRQSTLQDDIDTLTADDSEEE